MWQTSQREVGKCGSMFGKVSNIGFAFPWNVSVGFQSEFDYARSVFGEFFKVKFVIPSAVDTS